MEDLGPTTAGMRPTASCRGLEPPAVRSQSRAARDRPPRRRWRRVAKLGGGLAVLTLERISMDEIGESLLKASAMVGARRPRADASRWSCAG